MRCCRHSMSTTALEILTSGLFLNEFGVVTFLVDRRQHTGIFFEDLAEIPCIVISHQKCDIHWLNSEAISCFKSDNSLNFSK